MTYIRINGNIHSVDTYEKNGTKFYNIYVKSHTIVSSENKIVPAGYHKSRKYFSVEGIDQLKLDWCFVDNCNQIWILDRFKIMTSRHVLLSRAIELVDTEFKIKWKALTRCEKNECISSSGLGVLLEFVIHDCEISEKTKEFIQKERSDNPQFHPCSLIDDDLDTSEYYFNGEIHKIDCWRYDCYDSDCFCF
jgi:hypothetical protein